MPGTYLEPLPESVASWASEMKVQGRVLTRYPRGILAGQLASRLATPDTGRIENPNDPTGWNQWDYELAPFIARVADNTQDLMMQLTQGATAGDYLADTAQLVGSGVHEVATIAGEATASALGIPVWLLWAGIAAGVYAVLINPARARRYVGAFV